MAMGENWDGGKAACNSFSYHFAHVSIAAAHGGSWQLARDRSLFEDPGFRVVPLPFSTFDAGAAGALSSAGASRPRVLSSHQATPGRRPVPGRP